MSDPLAFMAEYNQRRALRVLARGIARRAHANKLAWLVMWPSIPRPWRTR